MKRKSHPPVIRRPCSKRTVRLRTKEAISPGRNLPEESGWGDHSDFRTIPEDAAAVEDDEDAGDGCAENSAWRDALADDLLRASSVDVLLSSSSA